MANTLTSPNMGLPIPIPSVDPGPDYANNLAASLLQVDSHNHTTGQGVQIPPAGLNINSALTFQNNPATNLSYAALTAGLSASTTVQSLSSAPASGINELWYTDSNGLATQITKNGVVNAIAASIPGQSYASGTFTWKQGAGSNTPANFDIGSVTIRPNTALTSNGVQLTPPSAIASFYSVALPLLPGSQSFLSLDASGNMAAYAPVANGLTPDNMAPRSIAIGVSPSGPNYFALSSSCGTFTTSSTSYVNVTNLSIAFPINSNNGYIWLGLIPVVGSNGYIQSQTSDFLDIEIVDTTNSTVYYQTTLGGPSQQAIPCGAVWTIVTASANTTQTYQVKAKSQNGGTVGLFNCQLVAYQIA